MATNIKIKMFGEEKKESPAVSCEKCRCLVMLKDSIKIPVIGESRDRTEHYCHICAPNYEERHVFRYGFRGNSRFFKKLEVDREGEPVGYKKINGRQKIS